MGKKDNKNSGKSKRILAIVLCAFLFISYMPLSSYALEGETEELLFDDSALIESGETKTAGDESLEDSDLLLEGYMDSRLNEEMSGGKRKAAEAKRRENLTDNEKHIYDAIKVFIDRVASGEESTAEMSIDVGSIFRPYYVRYGNYNAVTSESLGISSAVLVYNTATGYMAFSDEAKTKLIDFNLIFNALMADEPYALYWYDKTVGVYYGLDGLYYYDTGTTSDAYFKVGEDPVLELHFCVSKDYRATGGDIFDLDTVKTSATAQAVTNAANIITANASASDLAKLYAYKDRICALTSYNFAAALNANYPYGDPWQMIYVFDDDDTNKVVCEGYAKAFQYLCDHTDFDGDIECDSVTGNSSDGQSSELHMWNIIHMDDGYNYIADLTNSDSGAIGENGGLFLSPAVEGGSVGNGFWYDVDNNGTSDLGYIYDDETKNTFTEDELEMSTDNYEKPHVISDAVYTWADDGSSCTATGTCTECGETFNDEAVITSSVKIPATCIAMGTTTYKAKFNVRGFMKQTLDVEDIPMNDNHVWDAGVVTKAAEEGIEGTKEFTCSRCGETRIDTIPAIKYPTDLPAVKISKPKAGKKKLTVKWKKVSKKNQKKIAGIQIQVATDPGFTNIVANTTAGKKKSSKAIKGLNSKTKYYVRIRAYRNGSPKHVSIWKSKSAKVK